MITFDLPIKVPAYPRVQVRRFGRTTSVDAPDRLARLHTFYDELHLRLPARIRNARIAGPIAVSLIVWRSAGRCGDVDNLAKSVLDGLVRSRVIVDDDQVVDLRARLIHGKDHRPRLVGAIAQVPDLEAWTTDVMHDVTGGALAPLVEAAARELLDAASDVQVEVRGGPQDGRKVARAMRAFDELRRVTSAQTERA